jgi:dipeptidyl aminopeptidase/acylaminoacyl peptidase
MQRPFAIWVTYFLTYAAGHSVAISGASTLIGDIRNAETGRHGASTRPITTNDLLSVRRISGLSDSRAIAPDGTHIAFEIRQANIAENTYHAEWYIGELGETKKMPVFAGAAGAPELHQLADGRVNGDLVERSVRWSPDSKWIAYVKKTPSSAEVWRSDRDGLRVERVLTSTNEIRDIDWSGDGTVLIIESGRSLPIGDSRDASESQRGYLYDTRFWPNMSTRPIAASCEPAPVSSVPRVNLDSCPQQIWVYNVRNHELRGASQAEIDAFMVRRSEDRVGSPTSNGPATAIRRSKESDASAWLENADPIVFRGYSPPMKLMFSARRDRAGAIQCPRSTCTGHVEDAWIFSEDDTARVAFLRNEGHANSSHALYVWTPGTGTVDRILDTEDLLSDCGLSKLTLICAHETPTHPSTIVSINLRTGGTDIIFDPNPEMRNIELTPVQRLYWFDAFGNPTFGDLVYPRQYEHDHLWPLVIVQYRSRGFLSGGVGDEYPIHPLAAKGFFVLSFDRPDDEDVLERIPSDEGDVKGRYYYKRRRAFTALEAIVEKLVAERLVDPKAIGITGLSDGAETVNYALFHTQRYAAAAASSSDWTPEYVAFSNSQMRTYISNTIGTPDDRARWAEISIGLNAPHVTTPLLLQVSDEELLWSLYNYNCLEDANRAVELYIFPDEHHIKSQPKHRIAVYDRTIQWFQFWLQKREVSNPLDATQYQRWRMLRARRDELVNPSNN